MNNKKDPVCGRNIDPHESLRSEHTSKEYYFCSHACKRNFDLEPQRYSGNLLSDVLKLIR